MRMLHRICGSDSVNLCIFMQNYLLCFILLDEKKCEPNNTKSSLSIYSNPHASNLKTNILKRKELEIYHVIFFLRKKFVLT